MSALSSSVRSGATFRKDRRGNARLLPCGEDAREDPLKGLAPLKRAQAGRVRRGHIDSEKVRKPRKGGEARRIIGGPVLAVFVGAEINADNAAIARPSL